MGEVGSLEKFEQALDAFPAETKCIKTWYRKNWQKLSDLLSLKGKITPSRLRMKKGYRYMTRESLRRYCGRQLDKLLEDRHKFSYTDSFNTLFRHCKNNGTCQAVSLAVRRAARAVVRWVPCADG